MKKRFQIGSTFTLVTAAVLAAIAMVAIGCTAGSPLASSTGSTINSTKTSVPVSITDAPGDQVLAASLTLNSVVLTDSTGATASILSSPLTFEAVHLDAVQEPLFTPAVPEDTYTSVTLSYSNAMVTYVDPTTKLVTTATATLANTSQTITFAAPITINNTTSAILIDYLVAKSVTISGSAVTVTPTFNISAAPVPAQPTNGAQGQMCGVQGKISAIGTNQFTITNPAGNSMVITVNGNTQYQGAGITSFSQLTVGMLVQVDIEIQPTAAAAIVATRVEVQMPPNATGALLIGPVTAVTGSPATSFTQVTQQQVGPTATTAPVQTDTITINSSTQFQLPGRFQNIVVSGVPFTPTFNAGTLFAGQVVAVGTTNLSNNAATAQSVSLAPQTVDGTISSTLAPICSSCWGQVTLTLDSGSWLATLTGKTTVLVLLPPAGMQMVAPTAPAVTATARFNGFLFNNSGTLTLVAVVEGPGPGTPITQQP